MENIIIPHGKVLSGEIKAISSKSHLHRLIICGCLSDEPSKIRYEATLSKDITATISCLEALGADIDVSEGIIEIVKPIDKDNIPDGAVIDCVESGSTARFILPLASLLCKNAVITGSGKLPERPFEQLCKSLEIMGAEFSSYKLPITIKKCAKPSGLFEISGNVSSQFLSGLLFVLPLCDSTGIKLTTSLESAGYVDLTADAMDIFGVQVSSDNGVYSVKGKYTAPDYIIDAEGDWSNAAFWLCAVNGKEKITVTGLNHSSSQPDKEICEILGKMGMQLEKSGDSVTVSAPNGTKGISFDARNIPDLVPILAVRAAVSEGDTVISGISRLRIKESDRVLSVCEMINNLGGNAYSDENNIYIKGCKKLSGGKIDSYNDHRIAMSASVAACFAVSDVTITGSNAVSKSYPLFYEHYKELSGINSLETYNT